MSKSIFGYSNILKCFVLIITLIPFSVVTNTLNDVWIRSITKELSDDLAVIKNEELGIGYVKVSQFWDLSTHTNVFLQKLYTTFKYTSTVIDANKTVNEIAHKLEEKIDDIFSALVRAKVAIENMQTLDNTTKTSSVVLPCLQNRNNDTTQKNSKVCDSSDEHEKDHLKLDYSK